MEEYISNLQLTLTNIYKVMVELQKDINQIKVDIDDIKSTLYVDYLEEKGGE